MEYLKFGFIKPKPQPKQVFQNIVGIPDLLEIIERSIWTENKTNTLLLGPPGTAKSLIGTEVCEHLQNWVYYDCTATSGAGLIDSLHEHRNELSREDSGIVLDEIDKLNRKDQTMLYNFLESRKVDYKTKKQEYHFELKCKVIATSNSANKLNTPFKSRFNILHLPEYTFEEFSEIAVKLLGSKFKIPQQVAAAIADVIWNNYHCKDVRMLIHIGALIRKEDRADDIERLISIMIKYRQISIAEYN